MTTCFVLKLQSSGNTTTTTCQLSSEINPGTRERVGSRRDSYKQAGGILV